MFRGKWQANLKIYNTSHYLGTFDAEIDAAYAYDAKALELMGSDAATNFRYETRLGGREEEGGAKGDRLLFPIGKAGNSTCTIVGFSAHIGVTQTTAAKRWKVDIVHRGQMYHIGSYSDETEAARVYDRKALELWGPAADTNVRTEGSFDRY